ncbi:MAG TPA: hypothetical protein VGG85_00470 [Terracidiphilus sp.]|jgi:hypothetical protein
MFKNARVEVGSIVVPLLMVGAVSSLSAHPPGTVEAARIDTPSENSLRLIDDPHSGARWFLFRDPEHPGGPGRLVLESTGRPAGNPTASSLSGISQMESAALVHPGGRLIVEDHAAAFDAWLEATVLEKGSAGAVVAVRLKISGRVVRARILSADRAVLVAAALEVRP